MNEILVARDLHKSYMEGGMELKVLKGVDLKVRRGEIISIFGSSGVGKSTLLHLLGALDRPTSGEVYLDDVDVYRLGGRKRANLRARRLGFIFQFYNLLPEFTALENVVLPALIAGMWRKGALWGKAFQILHELGLEDRVNHRPTELSGGEQQRVAIGRALMNEPEVILADEPTGNLDEENSLSVLRFLWDLNEKRGQTLLIATHDEELARRCQRTFRLVDGKLREG